MKKKKKKKKKKKGDKKCQKNAKSVISHSSFPLVEIKPIQGSPKDATAAIKETMAPWINATMLTA